MRVKPFWMIASRIAPNSAPTTVPEPPSSAVPPMTAAATAMNIIWEPPLVGSKEPTRTWSTIPASPAKRLVSTNVATFTRLTLMPDSAALSGLPPAACAYTPYLVYDSATCMTAMTSRAQTSSDQRQPPSTSPSPPVIGGGVGSALDWM